MKNNRPTLRETFTEQWQHNRAAFVTWFILRLIVLAWLVRSAIQGYYENVFICILVLVLFMVPSILSRRLKIEFPSGIQIVILIHIFACEILGELACYYVKFPYWDTLTHTVWGFLCAALGYMLVDLLNKDKTVRFQLSPAYLAVVAFCFSMTIGVLWEFFEFAMDRIFLIDMQKDTVVHLISSVMLDETNSNIPIVVRDITSVTVNGVDLGLGGYLDIGLYDTMEDLFVNFIGALVFSLIGFFSNKRQSAKRIADQFIPRVRGEAETDESTADSPLPDMTQS